MVIGFDFRMGGSINAGIGRYSFELLDAMLENKQHSFVVFYNPKNVSRQDLNILTSKGAKLVAAPFRHYSLGEQILFPRLLKKYKLDLVHFPNFNVPIFYRGPYVVTIHDMVHHKISGQKKSTYWKFLAYKYIISQAAKRARRIISVTEAAKQEIVDYLGTDPNKISVTLEAPGRKLDQIFDSQKLKDLYLLRRPYLLFCGTLERKKNVVMLAQGFDLFLEKYKLDLDLVIAGKVDMHYPEIKEQALRIKNADHLVFTGFVENDKQAALYQNAYAFITASLHEGFGLPGLEAMQYGLPVLASNTAVLNEVYDNAAIYFDPLSAEDIADKINILVSDPPFHEQQQRKSIERVAHYSWNETARKTLEVYSEVLDNNFLPEQE